MKKRVYDYILGHSQVSIHEIAAALGAEELEVLRAVHVLIKGGYVKSDHPVPLSYNNSESNYYIVTGKKFVDN